MPRWGLHRGSSAGGESAPRRTLSAGAPAKALICSRLVRAQRLADGFASVDWVRVLGRYAQRINPLLSGLLAPMCYYWVTSQSEYSTDVLFRTRGDLEELMPRLLQYSTLYFEARDVMTFLGRKLNGNFQGDLVTDQLDFSQLPRRGTVRKHAARAARERAACPTRRLRILANECLV
jgi:hypothetical protein